MFTLIKTRKNLVGLTFEDDNRRILGSHESWAQSPSSRHSLSWILKWKLSTLSVGSKPKGHDQYISLN